MKRFYSFITILAIIFAANCSRVPANDNPFIGSWNDLEIPSDALSAKALANTDDNIHHLWIFNDANLGRYQEFNNNQITVSTDIKWSEEDGKYTISYPNSNIPNQVVSLSTTDKGNVLQFNTGVILAARN